MIKCFYPLTMIIFLVIPVLTPFTHGQEFPEGLVLWNGFGSDEEVLNSITGPNLDFYVGGGGIHVEGDREYSPGYVGNAVTLKGTYRCMDRVHNLVLENPGNYLDTEKGSIEFWYYQTAVPIAYSYGVYRFFGGSYGLGSGMWFQAVNGWPGIPPTISFGLNFGGNPHGVIVDIAVIPNDEWVHLAGVWDRNGIAGTSDTIRLYVNNEIAAAAEGNDWGTSVGSRVDICGGNDQNISGKFWMDELKIWDHAKTDFFVVDAAVEIAPRKLNLKSRGKWVTCYIELPQGYFLEDIDIETVAIEKINDITVDLIYTSGPAVLGDHDGDGIDDLMVKFERAALISILNDIDTPAGEEITLTVTGELEGDESFEGSDTIIRL